VHLFDPYVIDDVRWELLTQEYFSPIARYPNTFLLYTYGKTLLNLAHGQR
jgi:hypothetical protein